MKNSSGNLDSTIPNLGAIVLCGGQSSRLGTNKAELEFAGQTFLQSIVQALLPVAAKIVLVGQVDLGKHGLPSSVSVAQDLYPNKGPLEGIRVGLKTLQADCGYAFVTSCDVPLLTEDVVRFLWQQVDGNDSVVPFEGQRRYGITAIYRTSMHTAVERRIKRDQLRVCDLTEGFAVKTIAAEDLRVVDPNLDCLTNVNSMDDYRQLLERKG